MRTVQSWAAGFILGAVVLAVTLVSSCSKTPVAPTPTTTTTTIPVASPPTLTCLEGLSRATANPSGLAISFDAPPSTNGQGSVSVTCSPDSGTTFPIGTTSVTCTATDSLNRTGTCSFTVTVSKIPVLSLTRFMAFGDSITAGEVTQPVSFFGSDVNTRLVLVPSAAYPNVLLQTLRGRYSSQSSSFVVTNQGFSGERAANARNRFITALNSDRPEVVMILEGHNDIPGGSDGGASTGAFEVEQMVIEAKRRNIRVYLGTVLPARTSGNRAIDQLYIDDFNARLRIVASRQGIPLVDTYAALRTDINRYIGVDGLHPTEFGYAKIADTFFQAIQNTLEVR